MDAGDASQYVCSVVKQVSVRVNGYGLPYRGIAFEKVSFSHNKVQFTVS